MKSLKICRNPKCKREYMPEDNDDGFCGFACWEAVNCTSVPLPEEQTIISVEELTTK